MSDDSENPTGGPPPGIRDDAYAVPVGDSEVYVEAFGAESGEPIYFLHGGPGYGSFSFRDLMGDELAGYAMVYADQRAAGRSGASSDLTLDAYAADVRTVLAGLGVQSTTLLAHGFGAAIAVRAATAFPERVRRLVLVNPWLDMPTLAHTLKLEALALDGRPAEDEVASSDPEDDVAEAYALVSPKPLLDALQFPNPAARLKLEHSDASFVESVGEEGTPPGMWRISVRDELARVAAPTVVMLGQRDRTTYPKQAEIALSGIPHAMTRLFDAGHYLWLDDPEGFLDTLEAALEL